MRKQIAVEEDGTIVYQQCAWCGEEEVEDWIIAGIHSYVFCSKECLESCKKIFPQWFKEVKTKTIKLRDMTRAEHKAMTFFEAMPDHLRICIGMKKLDSKGAMQEIIDDSEIGRTLVKMNTMFEAGRKGNVNGK